MVNCPVYKSKQLSSNADFSLAQVNQKFQQDSIVFYRKHLADELTELSLWDGGVVGGGGLLLVLVLGRWGRGAGSLHGRGRHRLQHTHGMEWTQSLYLRPTMT